MNSVSKRVASMVVLLMLAAVLAMPAAHGQTDGNGDGSGGEKVVFTLGDDNDLDSMNPSSASRHPPISCMSSTTTSWSNFAINDLPPPGSPSAGKRAKTGSRGRSTSARASKWSDGEHFTAEDVEYTYQRTLEDRIGF